MGRILVAGEQMDLIFLNFPAAGAFVNGGRINLRTVFAGAGAKWLLIVHKFHSLYVEVGGERTEVKTEKRVVDKGPVVFTPCKASLHEGPKMVSVYVEMSMVLKWLGMSRPLMVRENFLDARCGIFWRGKRRCSS